MRKFKLIPSRSGLQFRPFNVNVIFLVLSCVSLFNFFSDLRYTHVFQLQSNNQTHLEGKSDVSYISMQNQTPKCKFQQSKSVRNCENCRIVRVVCWSSGICGNTLCFNSK